MRDLLTIFFAGLACLGALLLLPTPEDGIVSEAVAAPAAAPATITGLSF